VAQLAADRPGPDAGLLLLLLVTAVTGWLAGEGPALLAMAASTITAAVLTLRPVTPLPGDGQGSLLLFIATAVIVTAATVALRRRDVALRQARERRLEETEAAREAAESRADRLARLQRLTEAVGRQLEPAEMAARILALAIDDVRAAAGAIVSHDLGNDDGLGRHGLRRRWVERLAIRGGRPFVIPDASRLSRRFPRLSGERPGTGSAIAIPLPYQDRIVGALYLRYRTIREVPDEELSFLLAVGAACAAALERSRLYAAERAARRDAERAAARLRFLADASQVLAASLDQDTTLHRLAAIAVPRIADWCAVRVVSLEGRLELAAVAHADASRARIARGLLESKPASLADTSGAGAVARTGRREVVADLAEVAASGGVDPSSADAIRALGLRTLVNVPLGTGSQPLGVLSLAWSGAVHPIDDDELALAQDLAGRAATALDNARLHGDLAGHARRLQARTAEQAAVARLGQHALGGRELGDLLDDALHTVRGLTGSDDATLVRRLSARESCRIIAALGREDDIVGTESRLDASDAGLAILAGTPVRLEDLWREERLERSPGMLRQRVSTGLAMPIAGAEGAWGAIALHRRANLGYKRRKPDKVQRLWFLA
jgi:GAF domain-containing protein